MKTVYLVKYAEIAIKGKNRKLFENRLKEIIDRRLRSLGSFRVYKGDGRIYVTPKEEVDQEEVISRLTKIFGIVGVSPAICSKDKDFENIKEVAYMHFKELVGDKVCSFKVESKRSDKSYPLTTPEISREVGAAILSRMPNIKVDVRNPEYTLWIEVREEVYMYTETIPGPGGLPQGMSGKAAVLLSGGIDSPVAAWMMAKRGIELEAVHFHSYPYTSERAKNKVLDLAKKVTEYTGKMKVHIVPFTEIQLQIYEKCPKDQLTIIMKRMMMRIAEKIILNSEGNALITGESLGQVASQTIQSLDVIHDVVNIPVFQPLIAFDKDEIIAIAKKIDTFEISIQPYEDCCTIFVPKQPELKPKKHKIELSEKFLTDIDKLIEEAIQNIELIEV